MHAVPLNVADRAVAARQRQVKILARGRDPEHATARGQPFADSFLYRGQEHGVSGFGGSGYGELYRLGS